MFQVTSAQEHASQGRWRNVQEMGNHSDAAKAQHVRRCLVDAEVYPPQGADPEGYEYHEAVMRAELPDILAGLDYTDLLAIHKVARLLAVVSRDPSVFEYSAARTAALVPAAVEGPYIEVGELDGVATVWVWGE